MSENPTNNIDQWMLHYQYHNNNHNFDHESASAATSVITPPHDAFFSDLDSTIGTAAGDHATINNNSNNYSCVVVGNDLSPRGSIGKSAGTGTGVRRRSRASRRTPTTLLNASIKNFRTLVQQYTGCHHHHQTLSHLPSSSTDQNNNFNKKGSGGGGVPINLSFASPTSSSPLTVTNSSFGGTGRVYTGHDNQEYENLQMRQEQQQQQQLGAATAAWDENNGSDFSTFVSTDDYNTNSAQNSKMAVDNYGSWHAVLQ